MTTDSEQTKDTSFSFLEKLNYYALMFIVIVVSYIPFGVLYLISDILFPLFYYVLRYRRKIVRKNLVECFPDKTLREIKKIEKKFYHFFIDFVLETCKLYSISPDEISRRMKFVNIDSVNNLLHDGKSVALFLGHYGNWEWISSMALLLDKEAVPAQIYHKLRNRATDKIMKSLRERMGSKCVDMHNTVRYLANSKDDNQPHIVGFIADQSPKRREIKHFVSFLNHSVPVVVGSEKVTKHFGFNALFLSAKRVKRGFYECEFITLSDNPKSLPDYELTNLYFQQLEKEILQHPEFYLWTHNRFKYATIA